MDFAGWPSGQFGKNTSLLFHGFCSQASGLWNHYRPVRCQYLVFPRIKPSISSYFSNPIHLETSFTAQFSIRSYVDLNASTQSRDLSTTRISDVDVSPISLFSKVSQTCPPYSEAKPGTHPYFVQYVKSGETMLGMMKKVRTIDRVRPLSRNDTSV